MAVQLATHALAAADDEDQADLEAARDALRSLLDAALLPG